MKKNYYLEILEDDNIFELNKEKVIEFEEKTVRFNISYNFDNGLDGCNYQSIVDSFEGKKEFYLIINGVFNLQYDGFYVKTFKVVDSFKELEKYIKNESDLLCHIWYFNFDEFEMKKIHGEYDVVDRIYLKEIDGKIFAYDLYDDYFEIEFDSVEDFKEYYNNFKYKEYVKVYDTYEELKESYYML